MRKFYRKGKDVYEFEQNGSQDNLIESDMVKMTAEEIDRHIHPEKYMSDEEKYNQYLKSLKPLTRRQFRMAFILNGYDLDEIKAKILEIEDTRTRQLTLVEWEDAATFERDNASLILMAELLGLTDDQINVMWNQALTL